MTINAQFIDQIVKNVMREMQTRVSTVDTAQSDVRQSPVTQVADSKGSATAAVAPMSLSARVISEDVLVAANAAGQTISLQPGAILTPSGRDFIRKNGIRLATQANLSERLVATGTFIAVGASTGAMTAASAAGWKTLTAATEFEAASLASAQMADGFVACCGGEPSIVACLLNRNPAIRAAVVTQATNLLTLTTVMSPQVVCLDSSGWSFGEILRLLRTFAGAEWKKDPAGSDPHWKEIRAGGAS